MNSTPGFKFRITPSPCGWSWATYDTRKGVKLSEGTAATKAQAAACVVRFIARNCEPA